MRNVSRLLRSCAALAVPAAVLLSSSTASAQGWMKDRRYQEGAGIRAGDLELHPGIGGEVGYDSNWFFRSHKDAPNVINAGPANPVVSGGAIRITPSFSIGTTGAQREEGPAGGGGAPGGRMFAFRGTVAATYREFIGPEELRRQRNVSGNAAVRADIAQGRPVSLGLSAFWQRIVQPNVLADINRSFNRDDVGGGAEVTFMPGGGTLDLRAGYLFRAMLFEERNGTPFNRMVHEISVRNRWRFRPRTALFHDTSLSFLSYPNAERAVNYLNDATPVRTRAGVTGLVTERFGTTLALGYGASFFRNPAANSTTQFDGIIGQAEGTFYLSQTPGGGEPGQATLLLSTITLGFLRDFQYSFLGNFFTSNKGYARMEYWFGGRTVVQVGGFVDYQQYPPIFGNPAGNGPPNRVTGDFANIRFGGDLFAEYRFSDSFGLNTTIDYQETMSDTQIPANLATDVTPPVPGAGGQVFDLNWRRLQAFVGARYFF